MPTEVLYRKWRPQRFADVAGQEIITRTLINALAAHKVSHAYLFSGPRGTGKTTMGRLLAKAVNCERNAAGAESPGEPCNECASCVSYTEGRALDLVELDAASNRGIDEVRGLRENANYAPMAGLGAHKVYLIDEVHMLTDPAFNALLKTLEEPPPHVIFVLATTDAHKVPPTIVSRCQRLDFKRIPLTAMADRLAHIASEEGIDVPREGLELIGRTATGSLRDAINLLEQVCDSFGREPSLEAVREGLGLVADERAATLAEQALRGDLPGGLVTIAAVRDDGLDLRQFQKEVVMRLRELLFVQSGAPAGNLWTPEQVETMKQALSGVPHEKLVQVLKLFGQADLRADPLSPLPLELALAESTLAPAAGAPADAPAARPPAAPSRGTQTYGSRPAAPSAPRPPAPRGRAVPAPQPPASPQGQARPDISNASAEEIAAMLGSKAPVIPEASDAPEEPAPVASAPAGVPEAPPENGHADNGADLAQVVPRLYAMMNAQNKGWAAFLNGSCHAVSWQDGVLTLGFYAPFHKEKIEEAQVRRAYEEMAASVLGAPVSIRCIMTARPAKPLNKSPLVRHAVDMGAKIVSQD